MLNRHAIAYGFLAAGIIVGLFGLWHVQNRLDTQAADARSESHQRDLEQQLFALRICLSSGASLKDCRRVAHGAVLPVLTKEQSTKIVRILGQPGKAGALGPRGIQGLIGKAGLRGLQGRTGPQGKTGAAGPRGARGVAGAVGAAGVHGATGPPGARGPVGVAGRAGARGATGAPGASGAQGPPGPRGPTGPPSGIPGPPGPPGPGMTCPAGFTPRQVIVRLNPRGQVTLWACVKG